MRQVRVDFSVTWRVQPDLSHLNLTTSARRQVASAAGLAFLSKTYKAGCSSTMTGPAAAPA